MIAVSFPFLVVGMGKAIVPPPAATAQFPRFVFYETPTARKIGGVGQFLSIFIYCGYLLSG
jgi:hypothetical protein